MQILETNNFEVAANIKGDPNAKQVVILMPGRLDTKDYANFVSHLNVLASEGFYAAAIDVPGTWDSPGDIANYSTSTYIQTVNELIDYFGNRPTVLLGHSRGGATAMLASENPNVVGLVLVNAAYGNPSAPDQASVESNVHPEGRDLPPGNVRTKEQKHFDLPMNYFEDGAKYNPSQALANFDGLRLLIHGTKDEFVPIDKVKSIYSSLSDPKMFLEVDSAHDYRLYPEVIEEVNEALRDFIGKLVVG